MNSGARVYQVEPTPFPSPNVGPWRWKCLDSDHRWHFSVDDQGFTQTEQEAEALAVLHVKRFHSGPVEVCGKRITGRLAISCTQAVGHQADCYYVSNDFRSYGAVEGAGQ